MGSDIVFGFPFGLYELSHVLFGGVGLFQGVFLGAILS